MFTAFPVALNRTRWRNVACSRQVAMDSRPWLGGVTLGTDTRRAENNDNRHTCTPYGAERVCLTREIFEMLNQRPVACGRGPGACSSISDKKLNQLSIISYEFVGRGGYSEGNEQMHNLSLALFVAAGGAIGSVCRWSVGLIAGRLMGENFPWGTFIVNVVGSFIIGFAVELISRKFGNSPEIKALIVTGFLGGFTTFSSFSLDSMNLIHRGDPMLATTYIAASVLVSLVFVFCGFHAGKIIP